MPKQYDRALIEVEAKRMLEAIRDELQVTSLSATIYRLYELLPDGTRRAIERRLGVH